MNYIIKNKIKSVTVFFLLIFSLTTSTVQAAEIYFGTNVKEAGVGQSFEIGVFLNTGGENLNTVSSTISFPKGNVAISDIRDGNSIINMWVERPSAIAESVAEGSISFSGIIPGGYSGNNGYLFSIIFTANKAGKVDIASSDETILLNDGAGTKTTITHAPVSIAVSGASTEKAYVSPEDNIKPEAFTPKITHDPNLLDDKYFIAFSTADKQSGIDHYEIKEGFLGKYLKVESPYVLEDQSLKTRIKVKAVDKSGNARVEAVSAEHLGYKSAIFFSILILIVAFIAYRIIRSKKHGKIF